MGYIEMNHYDIKVKNNTGTGLLKIRIITHETIEVDQLNGFSQMRLKDVMDRVQSSYTGKVMVL